MEKTCGSDDWNKCSYAGLGGCYIYCKFSGYCIHQLPNDGTRAYSDLTFSSSGCSCPNPDVITARQDEHKEYCKDCGGLVKPSEECECLVKKPYFMDEDGVHCHKCKRLIVPLQSCKAKGGKK